MVWGQLALLAAMLVHTRGDYCQLCDPPGSHTGCLFPTPGPGKNCSGYTPSPLTSSEKILILDLHNQLRSKVARGLGWVANSSYGYQPQAADMRQLYWDQELELMSQRWADQCLPFYTDKPHDSCRDSARFPVGQNIVTSAYSQPMPSDVEARTLDWYNEIRDYDPAWVGRFFLNPDVSRQTGHYTQMMWGWTSLIGCSRVVFQERFENATWSVERVVCNYAPSGNFLQFPVYKVGEPCSKCPSGTLCSAEYKGLCAQGSTEGGNYSPNHEGSTEGGNDSPNHEGTTEGGNDLFKNHVGTTEGGNDLFNNREGTTEGGNDLFNNHEGTTEGGNYLFNNHEGTMEGGNNLFNNHEGTTEGGNDLFNNHEGTTEGGNDLFNETDGGLLNSTTTEPARSPHYWMYDVISQESQEDSSSPTSSL